MLAVSIVIDLYLLQPCLRDIIELLPLENGIPGNITSSFQVLFTRAQHE